MSYSLPEGSRTWICCPHCGEIDDVWRLGKTGVPRSRYGLRTRRPDPDTFKCKFCGRTFTSGGATRRECMGFNSSGDDEVAV